jgi:hypothetical protein
MSDTPRCDENAVRICFGTLDTVFLVPVEMAQQLERELAEKDRVIEQMREALELAKISVENNSGFGTQLPDGYKPSDVLPKIKAALAAERGER